MPSRLLLVLCAAIAVARVAPVTAAAPPIRLQEAADTALAAMCYVHNSHGPGAGTLTVLGATSVVPPWRALHRLYCQGNAACPAFPEAARLELQSQRAFKSVPFSAPSAGECKWVRGKHGEQAESLFELSDLFVVPWAPMDRRFGVVLRVTSASPGEKPQSRSYWLPVTRTAEGTVDGPGIFDLDTSGSPPE